MKAIASVIFLFIISLSSFTSEAQCPQTTLVDQASSDFRTPLRSGVYQTFTTTSESKPAFIQFRILNDPFFPSPGNRDLFIKVEIREGNGTSGNLLYSGIVVTRPPGPGQQKNAGIGIPVLDSPTLMANTEYSLVFDLVNNSPAIDLLYTNGDSYSGGNLFRPADSGSDMQFLIRTYESFPTKPVISGADALCSGPVVLTAAFDAGNDLQWYLNDEIIAGETGNTLSVSEVGTYSVVATDGSSCSNRSEPYIISTDYGLNVLENDTIAFGESIEIFGVERTEAGRYLDFLTGQAANGCDSLLQKDLVVRFDPPNDECGYVMQFDGVNDNVQQSPIDFVDRTQLTVEYFFKGSTPQSAVRIQDGGDFLVAGWTGGGAQAPTHILSWDQGTNGIAVGDNVTDGSWHHVAVTWEKGVANGFKSYLDGQLIAERNAADVDIPDFSSTDVFMGSVSNSSEFTNGSLDEVRIWNVARTAGEIRDGINRGAAFFAEEDNTVGLLAYYTFNDPNPLLRTRDLVSHAGAIMNNMSRTSWKTMDDASAPLSYSVEQFTIASGESMMIGGNEESTPGWFLHEILTSNTTGCDSLVYYDLVVDFPNQEIELEIGGSDLFFGDSFFLSANGGSSGNPVVFSVSDPSIAEIDGPFLDLVGVGEFTIFANQEGGVGFNSVEESRSFTVNKAEQAQESIFVDPLSEGAIYGDTIVFVTDFLDEDSPGEMVWGVSDPSLANVVEVQEVIFGRFDVRSSATVAITGAGELTVSFGHAETENYAASNTDVIGTISKASLTVEAVDISRAYGAPNPAGVFQYSGFVFASDGTDGTTDISSLSGFSGTITLQYAASATSTAAVGSSHDVEIDEVTLTSDNYDFSISSGGESAELSIFKAELVAKPQDAVRQYGAANPTFSLSYTGFVNGEDASVISESPTTSTEATVTSAVGTYDINVSGGSADNYTFTYESGILTVEKEVLTVTADNLNRAFGEVNPTLTSTITGFVNDEAVDVLDELPVGSTDASEQSVPGNYTINFSGGSDDNYDFSFVSGTLTIVKADQLIEFDSIPDKKTTDITFSLNATSNSGLPVVFSSSDASVISVSGSTARIIDQGTVDITASQSGDDRYNAASVSQRVSVQLVNDTRIRSRVDIDPIPDQDLGASAITLTADVFPDSAEVVWELVAGSAEVVGDILTIGETAGLVKVKASILATESYKASEDVIEFAVVDPDLITPTITFELPNSIVVTDQISLEAEVDAPGTSLSSADVIYTVVVGPGSISENILSFTGTGEVIVSAGLDATETTNSVVTQYAVEVFELHDVSGIALDENGDPFTNGLAIIADLNDIANTSASTLNQNGRFYFEGLTDGDYELYVVPFSSDYVLTFYGDVSPVLDSDAEPQVILLTRDFSDLTINMQSPPPPATEFLPEEEGGTISFFAQTGAEGSSRFVSGRVFDGDPLPNTLVILRTLEDEYVAADVTDDVGLITFTGLPTAEYKLVLDIPGVGEVSTVVDVVEGENVDITALIDQEGTTFEVIEVLNIQVQDLDLLVYPNPADQLFSIRSNQRVRHVEILDMSGKTLKSFEPSTSYDISDLSAGIFLIMVESEAGTTLKRLKINQ